MTTQAARLWMLLDDIDTTDDVAKGDDKLYRKLVQRSMAKRFEIMSGEEVDAAFGRTNGAPEHRNAAPAPTEKPPAQ